MNAYAMFCDTPGCREYIYIPRDATSEFVAFQTIQTHASQQGWFIPPPPSNPMSYCPRHIPLRPVPPPPQHL